MKDSVVIHWFRQDLRLSDNPALTVASEHGSVLPIYILDDNNAGEHAIGAAGRWWLHHSLTSLNNTLADKLSIYRGNPIGILKDLIYRYGVEAIYWNRCYEPWRIQRDSEIKKCLTAEGIDVRSYNGSLLWEPWTIKKSDGEPYKVFTPFYRKGCLQAEAPRRPLPSPKNIRFFADQQKQSLPIDQLQLLPKIRWDEKFESNWKVVESSAYTRFQQFIDEKPCQHQILN